MGELGTLTRVGEELLVSILQLIPPSSLSLVTRSSRALRTVGNNEACWTGHVPATWVSAGVNTTRGAGLLRAVEVKEAVCSNGLSMWDKVSRSTPRGIGQVLPSWLFGQLHQALRSPPETRVGQKSGNLAKSQVPGQKPGHQALRFGYPEWLP